MRYREPGSRRAGSNPATSGHARAPRPARGTPMPLIRFEIASRAPYAAGRRFGAVGAYEQVDGTAHFAVDPTHPANAPICDLKLAPRNASGLVEFAADLSIVLPMDAQMANGRCIVELPNRGRRRVVAMMNCSPP